MTPEFYIPIYGNLKVTTVVLQRMKERADNSARHRGGTHAEFVEMRRFEQAGQQLREYLYDVAGRK